MDNRPITSTQSRRWGEVIINSYRRKDNTNFYQRISPTESGGEEHEFGGYNISSEDIQHVEELTGTTLDKKNVFVKVDKTTKIKYSNGTSITSLQKISPFIKLSFSEFQRFENLKRSGMPHNRAIDFMAAAQQNSKPPWGNHIIQPHNIGRGFSR